MPLYKCPKCGRVLELPKGSYYCKYCGPEYPLVLVKTSYKEGESSISFIERLRRMREEAWRKMSDFEKAKAYLRAHASTVESRDSLEKLLREAGVKDINGTVRELVEKGLIIHRPEAKPFEYDLMPLIGAEEET